MSDTPEHLQTPVVDRAPGRIFPDPLLRALGIFLIGMALLLVADIAGTPVGEVGEDRAIENALESSGSALAELTGGPIEPGNEAEAARRERAQSTAFFLEQAVLAWRKGDEREPAAVEREMGAAAILIVLSKLWAIGWLLLPVGALAARLTCPAMEARAPNWTMIFAAHALGGSAALIALGFALYTLGLPAAFTLAPVVTAVVVLNAWLLQRHALLDRTTTLLRLAPLLVILTVALILARELLVALSLVG